MMTVDRSPLGRAVDLFFYVPVGLTVTVIEEIPALADKGRERVAQQTGAARLIRQLVVAEGRRRLGVIEGQSDMAAPADETGPVTLAPDAPSGNGLLSHEPVAPVASSQTETPAAAGDRPGRPESATLAIPGYDSLSASQVVQRLESLSPDELAAVADYEAAVRGRRTILTRIAQLQQG
jgi:hypothetical protein